LASPAPLAVVTRPLMDPIKSESLVDWRCHALATVVSATRHSSARAHQTPLRWRPPGCRGSSRFAWLVFMVFTPSLPCDPAEAGHRLLAAAAPGARLIQESIAGNSRRTPTSLGDSAGACYRDVRCPPPVPPPPEPVLDPPALQPETPLRPVSAAVWSGASPAPNLDPLIPRYAHEPRRPP